jgi:D-alanyl-D-alanine carboxypeptidase
MRTHRLGNWILLCSLCVIAPACSGSLHGLDRQLDLRLAAPAARAFGGVMLIADRGRIVYTRIAGLADHERRIPLTRDSRFVIGSLSKQITATLLLRLVDAGRLTLDDTIGASLDVHPDWAKRVRLRHLLNHTSGIASIDAPLRTEPGAAFAYSNLGYDLLGKVVARAAAEPYAAAAARLFSTCGMRDSTATGAAEIDHLAIGYDEKPVGTLGMVPRAAGVEHVPSGGIVSTAPDLVRWNRCLHDGKLLSAASYAAMTTPGVTRPHRWGDLGYGFGLQISEQDGLREISHSGYVGGFIATMAYYPQSARTLVVLENTSWDTEDVARVFEPHDRARDVVRGALLH